jgi:hypothetical protein
MRGHHNLHQPQLIWELLGFCAILLTPNAFMQRAIPRTLLRRRFYYSFLVGMGFVDWHATLEAIGITECNLSVMAGFDELRGDDLIATLIPS